MSDELKQEGLSLFRRRLYDEAVATFNAAADAYSEAGDSGGRLEMLNNIGVVRRMQQDWDGALQQLAVARQGFSELNDTIRQAQVLANVGDVYADRRHWDEAARSYGESAELFAGAAQSDDEHWMHSQVLRAISIARLRQRRWREAIALMQKSLEVRPRLGPHGWLFRGLLRLANRLLGGG